MRKKHINLGFGGSWAAEASTSSPLFYEAQLNLLMCPLPSFFLWGSDAYWDVVTNSAMLPLSLEWPLSIVSKSRWRFIDILSPLTSDEQDGGRNLSGFRFRLISWSFGPILLYWNCLGSSNLFILRRSHSTTHLSEDNIMATNSEVHLNLRWQ